MKISDKLKTFIKREEDTINNGDWEKLWNKWCSEVNFNTDPYKGPIQSDITNLLLNAGFNPLENFKYIPSNYFEYIEDIDYILIPKEIEHVFDFAFRGSSFKKIEFEEGTIIDKIFYMEAFCNCPNLETFKIPAGIKEIGGRNFWFCSNLKSVFLTKEIKNIDLDAFYGCSKDLVLYYPGTRKEFTGIVISADTDPRTPHPILLFSDGEKMQL